MTFRPPSTPHPPCRALRRGPWAVLAVMIGIGIVPSPGSAQDDVALLGRLHGSTPPAAYFERMRVDADAFRFTGAWFRRNPRLDATGGEVRVRDSALPPIGQSITGPRPLRDREEPVEGTFAIPLVLGRFTDTSGSLEPQADIQREFFTGPNTRRGTVTEYYAEASGGRVTLNGVTFPWVTTTKTQREATGGPGVQGLAPGTTGPYIVDILEALDDGSVDWGAFDNDGPDGIPNSGDDDGFVDVLAVMHPTPGAECGGNVDRIWSHRWNLGGAAGLSGGYVTSTAAAGGGAIRVMDYVIQPSRNCADDGIGDIGVFVHELGHGFGLPDLYCTGTCSSPGVGNWGLMGTGSWGCRGRNPAEPCHMGAWSKEMLGWATVEDVPLGQDLGRMTLEPVVGGDRILRIGIPGTREYWLLENRQPLGFDADIRPGLLVWRVDPEQVEAGWPTNSVNRNTERFGVSLVQADGEKDLEAARNRGDDGDVFPGSTDRRAFHAGSDPASLSREGLASGLTLLDLETGGSEVSFRLLTRFQTVTATVTGDGGTPDLVRINEVVLPPGGGSSEVAPFEDVAVVASSGRVIAPGVRTPFLSWGDGVVDTARVFAMGLRDTTFVATYGGRQVQVSMAFEGGEFGVEPGRVDSDPGSPGLWFEEGTAVTLEAVPTPGFSFVEWTGALAGAPNPVGLVVDAPVSAGAAFAFDFAPESVAPVQAVAGDPVSILLSTTEASEPVTWYVVDGGLPQGVVLDPAGEIAGSPAEHGSFSATLLARDALGLEGSVEITLEVAIPELSFAEMAADLLGVQSGGLTEGQASFLDRSGNRNGQVDVGDLRIYQTTLRPLGTVPPGSGEVRRVLITLRPGGAP